MKPIKPFAFLAAILAATLASATADTARITQSFDKDWMFSLGDSPTADQTMFDDANWRTLDVPHDWAIEGVAAKDASTGSGGGYRPSGVSWYRKRFTLPDNFAGKRIFIEFDGVMANSEVWINGHKLGHRPSGYVSFSYELTGLVQLGDDKSNVLAVRTDTTVQPASRWYSGQGIYRHVRLVTTSAARIEQWGLVARTPQATADKALAKVSASIENRGDKPRSFTVQFTLLDPDGHTVATNETPAQSVGIGETAAFTQEFSVPHPQLWNLGQGSLYRVAAALRADGATLDDDSTTFGIRDAHFDAATGFWLNGKNVRLKGTAVHHDGGAVGAAVPLRVWERRLERLRELGVNSIRTAHDPPAPEFLDLCDRMGFLVMDELFDAWTVGKPGAEKGYNLYFTEWGHADARDSIRRDRNHPSVILWSAGNEIHDTPNPTLAKNILAGLLGIIHTEDPTRPVTQALFRPNVSHDYTDGLADMLDVIGQNYREQEMIDAHRQKPTRKMVGTENTHEPSVWVAMRDNPLIAGQFLWTGVDYLGEAVWPDLSSASGLIDRTGAFKPRAFQRASFWSDQPMVHLVRLEPALAGSDTRRREGFDRVSNWTPKNPSGYTEATVDAYSNCEDVELLLNGKSLGSKTKPANDTPRTWKTPYEAGILQAIGKNGGKTVATNEIRTAGAPAKLLVETDRSKLAQDWNDISYVTVTAVDANGIQCPWASDSITFKIDGPGVIAAVDNGDRTDQAPYQASERKLFEGTCVALIKASATSGTITVTASATGLPDTSVTLEATAPAPSLP